MFIRLSLSLFISHKRVLKTLVILPRLTATGCAPLMRISQYHELGMAAAESFTSFLGFLWK